VLEKTQWDSLEEIQRNQLKKIRQLIKHSYNTVPYYHNLFKSNNIKPDEIQKISDLHKVPCLEKTIIQNQKEELISTAISKKQMFDYHSGGTNYPIHFLLTKEHRSWELAAEYRAYKWMGYEFGDHCLYLEGTLNPHTKKSIIKKITNYLENIDQIKFHKVTDDSIKSYIRKIRAFNPEVIRANASSVFFIGRYMLREGIDDIRPRLVITGAENLLPEQKKIVEDAFGCPVFDYYGSREFGSLAAECTEKMGYHITSENVLIEFINDCEYVAPGEMGNVIITNLRNFGMPFIRYNIGDVGSPCDELCNCGRGLPLMQSIGGRANDFLAYFDPSINMIITLSNPVVIAGVLYNLPLQNFIIKQENLKKIEIDIVPLESYSKEHTQLLLSHLETQLGEYLEFQVNLVEEIPALRSGKRSIVRSTVSPFVR
jgi:phenylacetate-CoA ligase